MTADARIIFVDSSGNAARSMSTNGAHLGFLRLLASAAASRTAEVGQPILSTVSIVAHAEAMVALEHAKASAADFGLWTRAEILRVLDETERFLHTDEPVNYYSAWVILETADID